MKMTKKELKKDYTTLEKLDDSEHDKILELSDKYEISHPRNQTCPDCWKDQIILIKIKIKEELQRLEKKQYILRGGVDVIYKGQRVNADTLTDELAEKLVNDGFDLTFFKEYPKL